MTTVVAVAAAVAVLFSGKVAVGEAIYPVQNCCNKVKGILTTTISSFGANYELIKENEQLKAEVGTLTLLKNENEKLRNDVMRLAALVDYPLPPKGEWIAAPIIAQGSFSARNEMLRVGKGQNSGIKPGAVVATREGLVGLVEDALPHSATVRLITDPAISISVSVAMAEGMTSADGQTIQPRGIISAASTPSAGVLQLRHLQRGITLPPRAKVVTNGLGGVFPPNLAVGFVIDELHADESGLEQETVVTPCVDFASLKDVFIRRET